MDGTGNAGVMLIWRVLRFEQGLLPLVDGPYVFVFSLSLFKNEIFLMPYNKLCDGYANMIGQGGWIYALFSLVDTWRKQLAFYVLILTEQVITSLLENAERFTYIWLSLDGHDERVLAQVWVIDF